MKILIEESVTAREIEVSVLGNHNPQASVPGEIVPHREFYDYAAKYLEEKVPMDSGTARQEAIAFSTGPGQALTYQTGKLQITKFLAEARIQQGEKFNLRAFHDFVWKNGNVPIALQRREYLETGDKSN